MTKRPSVIVIAVSALALVFLVAKLSEWLSPTRRALRRGSKGDFGQALADLAVELARKPNSPAVHGALGQLHLMADHAEEAEVELRKALELGSRSAAHHTALGWTLVRLGRLDEALPIAEEAHGRAREDFEGYCLYCGLMAHHGHGAEVAQLFDFLKRSSVQIQKRNPRAYRNGLSEKFDFARTKMNSAGFI
jgi:tetratricopeptide (TPR) repeat protein